MAVGTKPITIEEFETFIAQPENAERLFEYIGGEVAEVVSNPRSSHIALRIAYFINAYLMQHNIGYTTGADGGYIVAGERYIPDVGYISKQRQPQLAERGYNPNPPELAVEVLSPSNDPDLMRIKVANYLAANTVVWIVRPDVQMVEVYVPGQPVQRKRIDGTLDGGDFLPGFTLAVAEIFPQDEEA
jgi:Uma2 family endonuclease